MITTIILAGGVALVLGQGICNSLWKYWIYTVEIFQNHPKVDEIEVVCHKSWKDYLVEMIRKYDLKKVIFVS